MSAPTVIVATDDSPVRVRRAPKLEPPFDDEDDPTWSPAVSAGRAGVRAGHVGGVGALVQPGRGPRTQRPVTPRPQRGPVEPHDAGPHPTSGPQAGGPEAGGPHTGGPHTGGPHTGSPHTGSPHTGSPHTGAAAAGAAPAGAAAAGAAAGGAAPAGTASAGTVPAAIADTGLTNAATAHAARPAHAGTALASVPRHGLRHRHPTPGAVAAQRFVSVCIEILNGHRTVSHLRAVTAPADLKQITDQLISRTNRAYLGRPGRTVSAPHRVRLVGIRTSEPRDGVIEAVAVLAYGINTWAMAVRMERPADVWLCKLIQVV